jgi:hypothetical protein
MFSALISRLLLKSRSKHAWKRRVFLWKYIIYNWKELIFFWNYIHWSWFIL